MPVRVRDDLGLAVLRDASVEPPPTPAAGRGCVGPLRALARDGGAFFVDGEDPISLTVEVLVDTPLTPALAPLYRSVGGTFLLRAPTGTLHLSGHAAWCAGQPALALSVPPGAYGVLVHALETRDLAALQAAEARLVGAAEVAYRTRVDRLWFLGCLPTLALALTLLAPPLRPFWPAALLCAGLSWLPHAVLARGRRYRAVVARLHDFQAALPLYVLQLRPLESTAGLSGGWVTTE